MVDADISCPEQVPLAGTALGALPPDVSAIRVVVGRRGDPDIPRAGVQRPDDEPAHRAAQDPARARRQRGAGGVRGALGSPPAVVGQRGRGRPGVGLVQLKLSNCLCVVSGRTTSTYNVRGCYGGVESRAVTCLCVPCSFTVANGSRI